MKDWYSSWVFPCLLFVAVHFGLGASLDLSDLPGAAGTLHLYEAMQGSQRPHEINTVYVFLHQWGLSLVHAAWLCSILGVLMSFVGLLLSSWSLLGKEGLRSMAWFLIFWPPLHQYGWLIGVDSLAVGCAFLGAGMIWSAFRLPPLAWLLIIPASFLLKYAISLKMLVAPVLLCVALAPCVREEWKKVHILLLFLYAWAIYFAFPTLSSGGTLQGGLRIPEVDWLPVAVGWDKLQKMTLMGMPEGKWDQLIVLCLFGSILGRVSKLRMIPAMLISAVILVVSAFVLEDRLSTRLLTPAGFALLSLLPLILTRWRWVQIGVCLGLTIEFWAFVDVFQERRTQWGQAKSLHLPQAPSIWKSQYPENPTIFKGLSFYGSVRAREIVATGKGPVFSMRLRDGREAGIFVYAGLEGRSSRVLDPKWCCAGRVDDRCARRIVSSIVEKGGMIILPTEVDQWERVHKNERRWNSRLRKALEQQENVQNDGTWVWNEGKAVSLESSWPCPPQ